METSLKTGFAQVFTCCPKNLPCPKFGRAAAPLAPPPPPPGPYAYESNKILVFQLEIIQIPHQKENPKKSPEKEVRNHCLQGR